MDPNRAAIHPHVSNYPEVVYDAVPKMAVDDSHRGYTHRGYSDLETGSQQFGKERDATAPVNTPGQVLSEKDKGHRICGLRRVTFWLSLALVLVIIVAAVGGGVGGTLASNDSG